MVEHRGSVEQNLEDEHAECWRSQRHHDAELDQHRQNDLDWMEAHARGHIEVEVGMMHPMHTRECGYRMKHHVPEVDGEIEQQHRGGDRYKGASRTAASLGSMVDPLPIFYTRPRKNSLRVTGRCRGLADERAGMTWSSGKHETYVNRQPVFGQVATARIFACQPFQSSKPFRERAKETREIWGSLPPPK